MVSSTQEDIPAVLVIQYATMRINRTLVSLDGWFNQIMSWDFKLILASLNNNDWKNSIQMEVAFIFCIHFIIHSLAISCGW